MSASKRRQQHRDQLRADILDAARQIFVEDGYEGFSMRKLAERIEYSTATIYLHFNGKRELFDCLVKESFASLLESGPRPEDSQSEDPVEQVKQGMRRYVNFGLTHPDHYRLAFLMPSPSPAPEMPRQPNAAFQGLVGRVRRCVETNRFQLAPNDAADPEAAVQLIAQSLWAAAHGVTSLLLQRPEFPWVERDRLILRVIDSAVDALLAPLPTPEKPAKPSRGKRSMS